MRKAKRIGLVLLIVGLVAFGTLAATERLGNRERICACDGDESCLLEGEHQQLQTMQALRLQLGAERMEADGSGPHGAGGGRQLRRGA